MILFSRLLVNSQIVVVSLCIERRLVIDVLVLQNHLASSIVRSAVILIIAIPSKVVAF